jgi:hypothetical protein
MVNPFELVFGKASNKNNNMKSSINMICCCINYSDYLEDCLFYNNNIFNTIYVVTSNTDKPTIDLCSKYKNVQCILTESFFKNKAVFNKGAAQDYALSIIPNTGWLLIGDADCIYPSIINDQIINADVNNLYSLHRIDIKSKKELQNFIDQGMGCNIELTNGWYHPWAGNGYCQLFNFDSLFYKKGSLYVGGNWNHPYADIADVAFQSRWPQNNRVVLKGLIAHLGYPDTNWRGRITAKWE